MNIRKRLHQALTTGEIIATIATSVPITKADITPDLAKHYGEHAAEVRIPATAKQIQRDLRNATKNNTTPTPTLDRRTRKTYNNANK